VADLVDLTKGGPMTVAQDIVVEPHADYFYAFEDLSGSQSQLRLEALAEMIDGEIRLAGGVANRVELRAALANRLNTSEGEISRGILLGEGRAMFTRSEDGLLLQSL
jgi:hypothetical protein